MDNNESDLGLGISSVSSGASDAIQSSQNIGELNLTAPGKFRVIRRNGSIAAFDIDKISVAMTKAFLAVEGNQAAASSRIHETVSDLSNDVFVALTRNIPDGGTFHIEDIQDQVELALMRGGHQKVARSYVLYREQRNAERSVTEIQEQIDNSDIKINLSGGNSDLALDTERLDTVIAEACLGIEDVSVEPIKAELNKNIYDGITHEDVSTALVMSSRVLIEKEPNYTFVTARLLLDNLRTEALSFIYDKKVSATSKQMSDVYKDYFKKYLDAACKRELLDKSIIDKYDLDILSDAIDSERDLQFTYLGLQTLYDRYFIQTNDIKIELPQAFFMRVAMGLANNEPNNNEKAIEFYKLLSSFDFMSSTPTLFNSATLRPQLSSCYLSTIPDDLRGISDGITDDAMLSKFAGGLGNDWSSKKHGYTYKRN